MISLVKNFKYVAFASMLLAAALLTGGVQAADSSADIAVTLDGAHEVPANTSTGSGSGMFAVAADQTVTGSIKTTGVVGTMAHIHEAAAGKNGPVIVKLTQSSPDTWVVPAGAKLTDSQYASFKAGNLYVNVHSAAIPGGEIRGQLVAK